MLEPVILLTALINGLMFGAIYALVALGLTLIYGVLHIINFAHGALLMLAMYAVFRLFTQFQLDPYLALPVVVPGFFVLGYVLYRFLIGKLARGKDQNILLITLGLSVVLENGALFFFKADIQTLNLEYAYDMIEIGPALVTLPKAISFGASIVIGLALWALMAKTDLGKAIRAVAKERVGARLMGIDVDHIFAVSYGIGIACLGAAACLLMPSFYVTPTIGHVFVIIAFTTVVLGGMGSFVGALIGGFLIGITESFGGLFLGESLGQIGIPLIFVLILLFRPTGLFGGKA
ncbi:MAG: branched-chain amino acid ABC transporter permease [bacterium]